MFSRAYCILAVLAVIGSVHSQTGDKTNDFLTAMTWRQFVLSDSTCPSKCKSYCANVQGNGFAFKQGVTDQQIDACSNCVVGCGRGISCITKYGFTQQRVASGTSGLLKAVNRQGCRLSQAMAACKNQGIDIFSNLDKAAGFMTPQTCQDMDAGVMFNKLTVNYAAFRGFAKQQVCANLRCQYQYFSTQQLGACSQAKSTIIDYTTLLMKQMQC